MRRNTPPRGCVPTPDNLARPKTDPLFGTPQGRANVFHVARETGAEPKRNRADQNLADSQRQ